MASVVRITIADRKLMADGVSFGNTGPYERFTGRVDYEIDPHELGLQGVVDLNRAPRNSRGMVEFSGDMDILKPVDMARGNRCLIYDVNNRGNRTALANFNDAAPSQDPMTLDHLGNGFLMRYGYTVIWSGWQGDLLPGQNLLSIELPEASDNGKTLRGIVRCEFIADAEGVISLPLSGGPAIRSYEAVDLDTSHATLTKRQREEDPRVPIPPNQWQYARATRDRDSGHVKLTPSSNHIYITEGFEPGRIYELAYLAEGSRVMGLGLVGIRDLVSFLRYEKDQDLNPLAGGIEKAYGWGRSLCARVLRQFVYEGYNVDSTGRRVFEGIYPHVSGGGRLFANTRFAQVGRFPRQHEEHQWPSEYYPFAYSTVPDPISGKTDAVFKRPDSDPLVVHSHTATEYWQRHASTGQTDPASGEDISLPNSVRLYHLTSTQHMGARGTGETSQQPPNNLSTGPFIRALLVQLDRWVTDGTPPPLHRLPLRADRTLVEPEKALAQFPSIPGVSKPEGPSRLPLYDYGPDFDKGLITENPPKAVPGKEYRLFVPSVDADGNEVAGLRSPELEAPVGTYTGWSLRKKGLAEGELNSLTGSFVPFARTRKEREVSGDPRPSIKERYDSHDAYVRRIQEAAQKLVRDGLLLEEDAERYVTAAKNQNPLDPNTPLHPLVLGKGV